MRESYRTEEEAIKARDRWRRRGYDAHIDYSYAVIHKYVVIIESKVKPLTKRKAIAGMNVSDLERLAEEKRKEEQQIKTELKKAEDEFEKRRKDLAFQNAIARIISPIEVTLYKEEIKASNAGKLMLVRDLRKARDLIKGIKEELEKGMY